MCEAPGFNPWLCKNEQRNKCAGYLCDPEETKLWRDGGMRGGI